MYPIHMLSRSFASLCFRGDISPGHGKQSVWRMAQVSGNLPARISTLPISISLVCFHGSFHVVFTDALK